MTAVDLTGIDESLLIDKTRRIIRAIGLPATLQLLETWGGTYLELPYGRNWRKRGGRLAALIGQVGADAFHAEFAKGERRILLPKADKILIQVRNRQICALAGTKSVVDQALEYRMTVRQIQNIRREGVQATPTKPSTQIDLFPDLAA